MKKVVLAVMTIAVSANMAQASGGGKIISQIGRFEAKQAGRNIEAAALKSNFELAKTKTAQELNDFADDYVRKNSRKPMMGSREQVIFDQELNSGEFFQLKVRANISPASGKTLSYLVFATNTSNAKVLKDVSDIFSVELQRWADIGDMSTTTIMLTDETSEEVLRQIDLLVKKINSDKLGQPAAQLSRKTIKPRTEK